MTFFLFWLWWHILANIVHWALIGTDERCYWRNLRREERLIVLLWATIPLSWWIEPAEPAPWAFIVGVLLLMLGLALLIWAKWSNPYWSPLVETPERVIRTGAYRWLRHPSYVGSLMQSLGTVLVLGHAWGFLPLSLYAAVLWWRARREDRLLRQPSSLSGEAGTGGHTPDA